ncbi:hypothetical protein JAAARDRAFT_31111 [Jaapia argillacea MUCL 33604]|uniref:Integrase catalytic domain-containing protein n=1 Tax=Jaapia argillacea MUCL 33604 TaxID=933084 RepID=A0A067QDR4_9AGAM|nr:hypothetical protein JAAARDRAFT_31111 [Jaapia argillacea MUCL 33604]
MSDSTNALLPHSPNSSQTSNQYGINHIQISSYNSHTNRIVEHHHLDARESMMKNCGDVELKWSSVVHAVFWTEHVIIQKSAGYSPFYMAHSVEPLFPFNITEATYLSPPIESPLSTIDLISLCACQLKK